VAASHSEVVLAEAAERDIVVAFVGAPHRINDRGSSVGARFIAPQVQKALREIGYVGARFIAPEDYYLAEQTGWVLYLEGSTDLAILQAFARRLSHRGAMHALQRPFVRYVGNDADQVRRHFFGLREAVPHLKGVALFDRRDKDLPPDLGALGLMWRRREIESYLTTRNCLLAFAESSALGEGAGPLIAAPELERRRTAMGLAVAEVENALRTLGKAPPWDGDLKVSDDFLPAAFERHYQALGLPNLLSKTNYHLLAEFIPLDELDPEIAEKLDAIAAIAAHAAGEG